VFADPEHLDIRRQNAREHLSLGYGAHYCLGAPLAHLEANVVRDRERGRPSRSGTPYNGGGGIHELGSEVP
jgi:hypothetical protein